MTLETSEIEQIISSSFQSPFLAPYVDGDALTRRYQNPERKFIRTDVRVVPALKPASLFSGSRIAIRQAGVGLTATLLEDGSRVPQSVYLYWTTDEARRSGYTDELILAAICSRVLNFYHMKTSGEVDPARAFAKVTHDRMASFPIPKIDSPEKLRLAAEIRVLVRNMLTLPAYGGETDWKIESNLRALWGITGDEGRYINGFFAIVPDGQARRDMFPSGPPSRMPYPAT